jgi:prolyl 4-hydroxylase
MKLVDFIYEKHSVLTKEQCEDLINIFEDNVKYTVDGVVGSGVNKSVKESTDFHFSTETLPIVQRIYGERIPDMLDAVMVEMYKYMDQFPIFEMTTITFDPFNLQKYNPGEGFHQWHYESTEEKIRLFVWMIYLNDVPDGGTKFMMQERTVKAEQGKLVFFPADWTYTHKGEVSDTTTKYILTGWISLVDSHGKNY